MQGKTLRRDYSKLRMRRKYRSFSGKQPPYRTIRCKVVRGLTKWCYGLCKPVDGIGFCGRVAPHGVTGRTQRAIARHNDEKKRASTGEAEAAR